MTNESISGGIGGITDIANRANDPAISMASVLIIGFIVVLITFISIYNIYRKGNKERLDQYIKREDRILQAFEKNSESNALVATAMAGLKSVLEVNDRNCDTCKAEQLTILRGIQESQSDANMKIGILLERKGVDVVAVDVIQRTSKDADGPRQAETA